MSSFDLVLALLGAIVLGLGLASSWLSRTPFPPTLLALGIGIVIGPEVLNLVDPSKLATESSILEKGSRIVLGIGLMGVALRIPREFPRREWRDMLKLVGIGMGLMWIFATAVTYWLLAVPFGVAALIGAILTPTDPVAATPVVTGPEAERNLPERIRHTISFESGANDGLSYLFVFLPLLLLTRPTADAMVRWGVEILLWHVIGGALFGILLGWAAGRILQYSERRNLIRKDWRIVYTVALALVAIGAGKLIGTDEVLVVFAAGTAFAQVVSASDRENEESGQEAVNRFFSIPIFVLLGTTLPWAGWHALGWPGLLLCLAVLLFRRLPAMLVLWPMLSVLRRPADALFVGWFGPMAVSAIYYAAIVEHKYANPVVWPVVSLVICASVVAHGMSSSWLTSLYGRRTGSAEQIKEA